MRIAGHYLALFELEGRVLAIENLCMHVGYPLDEGIITEGCVVCPWHGWRYDLVTGEHLTMFGRRHGLRRVHHCVAKRSARDPVGHRRCGRSGSSLRVTSQFRRRSLGSHPLAGVTR